MVTLIFIGVFIMVGFLCFNISDWGEHHDNRNQDR